MARQMVITWQQPRMRETTPAQAKGLRATSRAALGASLTIEMVTSELAGAIRKWENYPVVNPSKCLLDTRLERSCVAALKTEPG
jgi:hypothetical protein